MYNAERQRILERAQAADIETYMNSLEVCLEMGLADAQSVPRVAQLTQKTNQFNLTTKRYTELDISRFSEEDDHDVFWCRVSDKLGDMGIVGSCIVKYEGDDALIDTLLMSCRALGRKIELRFLTEIIKLIRQRGAKRVLGHFISTAKNSQVKDFFPNNGFHKIEGQVSNDGVFYGLNVCDFKPENADWFYSVKGVSIS